MNLFKPGVTKNLPTETPQDEVLEQLLKEGVSPYIFPHSMYSPIVLGDTLINALREETIGSVAGHDFYKLPKNKRTKKELLQEKRNKGTNMAAAEAISMQTISDTVSIPPHITMGLTKIWVVKFLPSPESTKVGYSQKYSIICINSETGAIQVSQHQFRSTGI